MIFKVGSLYRYNNGDDAFLYLGDGKFLIDGFVWTVKKTRLSHFIKYMKEVELEENSSEKTNAAV